MPLANLREFLGAIDAAGDLRRIEHPVSVDKEITEVADRCMKSPGGGPALLFTAPTLTGGAKSRYPVAVNLFGSERRMSLALGVECRSEEHTSELQSHSFISYAVFCLKKTYARVDLSIYARGRTSFPATICLDAPKNNMLCART